MIAPGSRLGSFEIIGPLGTGGMGEVYRARDTRLNRAVAIKLLPSIFSEHSVRLQRFEQEARSASSLNHPNIVTIYELGYDGACPYIAMELVEGKTLRELLNQGALPIRKVIEMAAQVADGLTKAHEAGITHRDLKPENLMVTHEGLVKILDFGLAKLTSPSGADTVSSLTTASVTASGAILGTAGYMSPEQVAGKGLDFRSDQFSFGLVLYELVAGKRAFQRGTTAETLVAILREQAEPVGVQNREAPAPLCWAIERCMEKEPEKRYASTRELARELAAIGERLLEKPAPPAGLRASNLPVSRTGFVGREKEVAAGTEMLQRPEVRLVTITGPGGIGKTRLAIEVATELCKQFSGGDVFCTVSATERPGAGGFGDRSDPGHSRGERPVAFGSIAKESARIPERADAFCDGQFRAPAAGCADVGRSAGNGSQSENSGDQPSSAARLRRTRISCASARAAGFAFAGFG